MRIIRPEPCTAPHAKSAIVRFVRRTTVTVKAHILNTFSSLDNFVIMAGAPTIVNGMLSGYGAVRYRAQMGTDNYKVTGTIGDLGWGTCWLVTCASEDFSRLYALEMKRWSDWWTGDYFQYSFVKITAPIPTDSTGLFGIILSVLATLFGFLFMVPSASQTITRWQTVNGVPASVNDTVTIWYDEENSTLRAYRNSTLIISYQVPPREIPHGDGFRYFGVFQGVDGTAGYKFTTIEAQDV